MERVYGKEKWDRSSLFIQFCKSADRETHGLTVDQLTAFKTFLREEAGTNLDLLRALVDDNWQPGGRKMFSATLQILPEHEQQAAVLKDTIKYI